MMYYEVQTEDARKCQLNDNLGYHRDAVHLKNGSLLAKGAKREEYVSEKRSRCDSEEVLTTTK